MYALSSNIRAPRRSASPIVRLMTVAALVLAAAACGKDSSTAPKPSVAGAYALQKVDGHNLPATIFDGPVQTDAGQTVQAQLIINSGGFELLTDGTYTTNVSLKIVAQGQSQNEPMTSGGRYTQSGNTIHFTDDDGTQFDGTLQSGKLTIRQDILQSGTKIQFDFAK